MSLGMFAGLPRFRHGFVSVVAALVALTGPLSAAQLCPLASPAAGTTTVSASPDTYYPGVGTTTANSVTVGAARGATAIAAGDEILIIQMQDSAINTSNTTAYGSGGNTGRGVTSDNTSGDYEYAIVTAVAGTTLTVTGNGAGNGLINTYHTAGATATKGQQTFQVVRVPRYNNVTLNSFAVTPWDGKSGGIFAIDASGTITATGATISADAAGFFGGGRLNQAGLASAPAIGASNDYVNAGANGYNGNKGEGTVGEPQLVYNGTTVVQAATDAMPGGSAAQGSPGIAGGGATDGDPRANDYNSGGGGGANGGDGGKGGNNWSANETGSAAEANGTPNVFANVFADGGNGGTAFAPRAVSRVVFGGGGGAGAINNNSGPLNTSASGGLGGGMILIRAGTLTGGTLSANGGPGQGSDNDGGGGGGAGGSIVVTASTTITGVTASAKGGVGGSTRGTTATATEKHGPGGGGGGGVVITSSAVTSSVVHGTNGTTLSTAVTYGAAPGTDGTTTTATPASVPGVSSAAECLVNALTITKTGTTNASPGGLIQYTVTISNAGPGQAGGTTFSDTIPTGLTIEGTPTCAASGGAVCGTTTTTGQVIAGTITTLPVGGAAAYTIYTLAPTTPTNPYTNQATVAPPATNTDPNSTQSQKVVTNVAQASGLGKTVRNVTTGESSGLTADTGKPGDTLEYDLSFTNNTGAPLKGFGVSDPLPTQTTFLNATCGTPLPTGVAACGIANPAVGANGTVTFTYYADAGKTTPGTLPVGSTVTFVVQVKIK